MAAGFVEGGADDMGLGGAGGIVEREMARRFGEGGGHAAPERRR